jgi:hypothetical protein
MTEEEQRYAEAWKELRQCRIFVLAGLALSVLMLVLSDTAYWLGFTSVAITAMWLFILCFFAAILWMCFEAQTFPCPRCGARGAFWRDEDAPECHRCKLPIYSPPSNPDPNWRE